MQPYTNITSLKSTIKNTQYFYDSGCSDFISRDKIVRFKFKSGYTGPTQIGAAGKLTYSL